jgi:alginate O-acetyltransferase complex protein AlgI
MLTMILGGLWHGANWTFLAWGVYHGLLLVAYRLTAPAWDRLPALVQQFLMFFLVIIGWVFFRAETFEQAGAILTCMFTPVTGSLGVRPEVFPSILALSLLWAMAGPNAFDWHRNFRWNLRTAYVAALLFGGSLAIIMGTRNSPFLYFQF